MACSSIAIRGCVHAGVVDSASVANSAAVADTADHHSPSPPSGNHAWLNFIKDSGPFQLSSSIYQHWVSSSGVQGQDGPAGADWWAQSMGDSCYTICNYADSD